MHLNGLARFICALEARALAFFIYFVCFKLLLYPISFFFIVVIIRSHKRHRPLNAGRALVLERAPLATSHAFVPVLDHQRDRRQVLQ